MATVTEGVKLTKRRKRSEIEEGPNAEKPQSDQKPVPTAAAAEVLPEKKRRKKKTTVEEDAITTNVDSDGNPVAYSSKYIETKQAENLGKPELSAAAAEAKPGLLEAAEAEAIIEMVQGKKKKQKKSTEGKKSDMEDGFNAENPELVQNPQLDQNPEHTGADAGVLLKTKRIKKKTVAEDATRTNVDTEFNPVVDSSKSIEIEQTRLLLKQEIAAEAETIIETVPSKKKKTVKKKKKKTGNQEPIVINGAAAEGNPIGNGQLSVEEKQSQLLQKLELVAAAEWPESLTVTEQVPDEIYVETCVICRRKGHSIHTCCEVNDEALNRKPGKSKTLKRQAQRHRRVLRRRSQCPKPPQDTETKEGQEDRSLATGSAVQDGMAVKTCSGKEDEFIAKAGSASGSKKGRKKKSKEKQDPGVVISVA